MARLRVLSGKSVCNILTRHGFVEVRRRGSHIIMQRKFGGNTVIIPVLKHRELRSGTLQSIIRQFGIPRNEFEM